MNDTLVNIETRLRDVFNPSYFKLLDESHLHIGHAGAEPDKGHYAVEICSALFKGKSPVERHRLVYEALGKLMQTKIHALRIQAKT